MGLEGLRKEIEEIDREIVKCLARRLEIVREVGRLKSREGKTATDDERELYVKSYWRELSAMYGVPAEMAKELLDIIIKYSKYIQLRESSCIGRKTVTFIGYGRMGKILALYSVKAGHDVIISGRDIEEAGIVAKEVGAAVQDVNEAIGNGDFIVLSLPPKAFMDGYVDSISNLLKGKIVMDILSSKIPIFNHMEGLSINHEFKYVSAHPLFGPQTSPIGEKIAVIPSKTGVDVVSTVCGLWRSIGLDPVVVDVTTHEKAMAVVQVLTHLHLLAFQQSLNEILRELNLNPYTLSTPTFREIMSVVRRIENIRDVIIEIQKSNPFSDVVRSKALSVFKSLVLELGGKDALHN